VRDIQQTSQRLGERLSGLTSGDLAAPHGEPFPQADESLSGWLHFSLWHDSYHVEQLGLIRRILGKDGLA